MKKLIPVLLLITAGCTSPGDEGLSMSNESTSQNGFAVPENWKEVVPGKEIHADNMVTADGGKLTLDEFNDLIRSGRRMTAKFYVDESGQTNAVIDVAK